MAFLYHIVKSTADNTANPAKANADKYGSRSFHPTTNPVGLCKYRSSGVNKKTINIAANESDKIAASFVFDGAAANVFFAISQTFAHILRIMPSSFLSITFIPY